MRTVIVAFMTLLATCSPPADEQDAAAVLEPQVGEIRAAASNGDRIGAHRELAKLLSIVEELRRSDDLTDQKADEILEAADDVARYLSLLSSPTPARVTRSPSPSRTARPTTPPPTTEPSPTETPEPAPTQEPAPTETPDPPDDDDGSGNQGQDGLPGILRGPG